MDNLRIGTEAVIRSVSEAKDQILSIFAGLSYYWSIELGGSFFASVLHILRSFPHFFVFLEILQGLCFGK